MLYDPKWEVQTKADPFALTSLIAWLEKQPADGTYCYQDSGHCLLAQYFKACGYKVVEASGFSVCLDGERIDLSSAFQNIPLAGDRYKPRTFAGALARARTYAG